MLFFLKEGFIYSYSQYSLIQVWWDEFNFMVFSQIDISFLWKVHTSFAIISYNRGLTFSTDFFCKKMYCHIWLNMLPRSSFVSNLFFNYDILQGSFRHCKCLSSWCLVPWINNHLFPVGYSTFLKPDVKWHLVYKCDTVDCVFFCHFYCYLYIHIHFNDISGHIAAIFPTCLIPMQNRILV